MAQLSLPEYNHSNFQIPDAQVPGVDPRFKQVFDKQKQLSDQFRQNLPQLQDQLGSNYARGARQQLAGNLTQVKKDFNARGLLRSGAKQGADASNRNATAFDIAQGRSGINRALSDQADQLENNVLNTGYQMAGNAPQLGQGLLQGTANAINADMANNAALNEIFGGAGKGLGYIFSKFNNKDSKD